MALLSRRAGRLEAGSLLSAVALVLAACSGDDEGSPQRDAGPRVDAAAGHSGQAGRAGAGAGGRDAGAGARGLGGSAAAPDGAPDVDSSFADSGDIEGGASEERPADGSNASPDGTPDSGTSDGGAGATADAVATDGVATDALADTTLDAGADAGRDSSSGALTGGPCRSGATGRTAWRFGYSSGSTSSTLLEYGMPDRSNWEANPVYATSFVDAGNGGGLELGSGNWILIRYSVVGVTSITRATLSIYGRSYATAASGSFEGWTPLHGTSIGAQNSVSNAWPYRWYSVDFTGRVLPGDAPGLTGIRLYARGGSNSLVINQVELCIEGS